MRRGDEVQKLYVSLRNKYYMTQHRPRRCRRREDKHPYIPPLCFPSEYTPS